MALPADFLKSVSYFEALGSQEMEQIGRDLQEVSYSKGEIIFLEGEPCRGLFVVKSGLVRIFKSSAEGREQVLLITQPGDSFNDVPVFDGGPNPASAAALEPTVVYLIPRATLISLVAGCPAALAILKLFAGRLRHLTAKVEELAFQSVVSRLAKLLLGMAVAEDAAPVPRLTQDEMAAMVGSVRDVIGRALRHMEKSGAIKMERHRVMVVSPEKLKEMM
ncbi:MAG: Crp/Fnr family transcriptional regulator [Dehalococcoidales bacterium]|nr:Crp/Fnr family transcriptional regulator [Dehalococcoidales bacterium]